MLAVSDHATVKSHTLLAVYFTAILLPIRPHSARLCRLVSVVGPIMFVVHSYNDNQRLLTCRFSVAALIDGAVLRVDFCNISLRLLQRHVG